MARPLPKIMLVFAVDGVLCRLNSSKSASLCRTEPSTLELKKGLEDFNHFLFIRNRLFIKVGVWEKANDTELLSKSVFKDYHRHLSFKYNLFTENEEIDLERIWANYQDIDKKNTAYINVTNERLKQKSNFLHFPKYQDDSSLSLFLEYLKFFSYQYVDGRVNDLETFIKRIQFIEYYSEKSKVYRARPQGEASRFW